MKLIFGKVETGFKILFDVLEGTPRNTKSKEDIIVRLCRDTNSALNNDITSLKQAVMKVSSLLLSTRHIGNESLHSGSSGPLYT